MIVSIRKTEYIPFTNKRGKRTGEYREGVKSYQECRTSANPATCEDDPERREVMDRVFEEQLEGIRETLAEWDERDDGGRADRSVRIHEGATDITVDLTEGGRYQRYADVMPLVEVIAYGDDRGYEASQTADDFFSLFEERWNEAFLSLDMDTVEKLAGILAGASEEVRRLDS